MRMSMSESIASGDLIYPFRTKKQNYVYEGSSNHILRVSENLYQLASLARGFGQDPATSNLYCQTVLKLQKEKKAFFFSHFPSLSFPCTKEQIVHRLNNNVRQLTLNVTESCNLRCEYCTYSGVYYNQRRHGRLNMPWSTAKQAIDFFLKKSNAARDKAISFYGGEPLLAFDFIKECVNYVRSHSLRRMPLFNLTTNGTILTQEMLDFFRRNDFYVLISLDGPKKIHDAYRKTISGKGSFEGITKNLRVIKKYQPAYYRRNISFNVIIRGPADVRKIAAFFQKEDFRNNRVQVAGVETAFAKTAERYPWIEKNVQGFDDLKEEYVGKVTSGRQTSSFQRGIYEPSLIRLHKRDLSRIGPNFHYPNGICLPGERKIFVDSQGKIHPCEKVGWDTIIGTVEDGFDIQGILEMIAIYSRESTSECERCWAARLCSICFASCWASGFDKNQKTRRCQEERLSIGNALSMYCEILEKNDKALDFFKHYSIS